MWKEAGLDSRRGPEEELVSRWLSVRCLSVRVTLKQVTDPFHQQELAFVTSRSRVSVGAGFRITPIYSKKIFRIVSVQGLNASALKLEMQMGIVLRWRQWSRGATLTQSWSPALPSL